MFAGTWQLALVCSTLVSLDIDIALIKVVKDLLYLVVISFINYGH